jgi:3-oxoacyl-(acyl-carrier-protein) synthase III
MPGAQIVDVVSFLPEHIIENAKLSESYEGKSELDNNVFFKGVSRRRFASPEYQSSDLGTKALNRLLERTGTKPEALDLILCSCILSDHFWPGIGPALQNNVGACRATVLNIDTGCSSYLSMLNTARAFIESGIYNTVAIVTVTNFISRLPEFQNSKQSWVLGDGASATLLINGESSFLASYERSHGENYGLFVFQPDIAEGRFLNYWERGCGPITVNFSRDMVDAISSNALALVPDAVQKCLAKAGLTADDVSLLITHQPNAFYIREWRNRIGIGEPRVHDTLEHYGNLFQSSIPVTLADALEKRKVQSGDVLVFGAFSNGGDFVSSLAIRWQQYQVVNKSVRGKTHFNYFNQQKKGGIMQTVRDNLGPWSRESLVTNGIKSGEIPGLYSCEDHGIPDIAARLQEMTKDVYQHEEIFGSYCHIGEYIHCPVDMAFEYAANIYSLEEWTFSLRQFRHIGGGLYKGKEFLAKDTPIYIRAEAYPECRVVDYPCAWDQGDELWMRYYFRFIDAMPTLRKPGTVMLWTNCKHPYYDRSVTDVPEYISNGRARLDRKWVGDIWPSFDAIHRIETQNLKSILEYRFANK